MFTSSCLFWKLAVLLRSLEYWLNVLTKEYFSAKMQLTSRIGLCVAFMHFKEAEKTVFDVKSSHLEIQNVS